ncbi:hypothetical protein HaLaN_19189 [Haematococcus lacustris]|uniref:Uncharacterized protein n=1 Tax=Haematococcus lacustris TaxID=44745 RepID=A0A699ZQ71_HAELA|nr:hypothetical protein HaLaN_19189 [Haematococcus lacustris]
MLAANGCHAAFIKCLNKQQRSGKQGFSTMQEKLPAKGKEYPGLGYKRVRDKPLKAQLQQQ